MPYCLMISCYSSHGIGKNGRNANNDAGYNPQAIKNTWSAVRTMSNLAEFKTRRNVVDSGPKAGRSQLKQPTFNCSAKNNMMN